MFEERAALRAAVRGLLGGQIAADGMWARLCKEIGVAGLTVPEEYGGSGATLGEAAVVLEELGRVLSPAPMLGTVLAVHVLLESGDEETRARLLPAICSGERIVTAVWAGCVFPADTVLVVRDGTLSEIEGGIEITDSLDLTRPTGRLRSEDGSAPGLRDVACAALAAEQLGTAERALELTVAYVQERHQFGRPIGSFQVLQHRLAEAYVRVQAARSASEAAVQAVADGSADAPLLAAAAKITCSETLRAVAAEMVQMHGGIAITWEHDAHRFLRRAWATAQMYGSPESHVARLTPTLLSSPD
ncbi:acyl-CoA dehydrogenase family protein [Actinoplanes sichuanensis]|uniref:Acyl-CoA dehydrogenase family protein n=1 Tax=Actinoplanes sichuanensis TaxID=512349 RepID=A0ABW4APK7_9ACTN|nr:acyl-CoA dehydrogenase family protein [Actinoplanes sichuanensis]